MAPHRRWDQRLGALLSAIVVILAALLTSLVLVTLVLGVLTAAGVILSPVGRLVLLIVLTQGVAFVGVSAIALRLRGQRLAAVGLSLPRSRDLGWIATGYVASLAAALVGGAVAVLVGVEPAANQLADWGRTHADVLLIAIPLALFIVGPGEELLFRGVVQRRLRPAFGPVGAVVLGSVLFALAHAMALVGDWPSRFVTMGILVLPSLVFGWAYERTGKLWVPALIHGLYDVTLLVLAYLAFHVVETPPP